MSSVSDATPSDDVEEEDDLPAKKSKPLTPGHRPTTRTPLLTLPGHYSPVTTVVWREGGGGEEDGVSDGWDHCIRVWDIAAGVNTSTLVRDSQPMSVLLVTCRSSPHAL